MLTQALLFQGRPGREVGPRGRDQGALARLPSPDRRVGKWGFLAATWRVLLEHSMSQTQGLNRPFATRVFTWDTLASPAQPRGGRRAERLSPAHC